MFDSVSRIALISDLHLDFWSTNPDWQQTLFEQFVSDCAEYYPDLIVLAGDIFNGQFKTKQGILHPGLYKNHTEMFRNPKPFGIPLLVITGNHDYYGREFPHEPEDWFNDQIFATTFWTDFKGAVAEYAVFKQIADKRCINGVSWMDLADANKWAWERIKNRAPEVLVTHFPPSRESVMPRYRGDPLNPYFTNDLDWEIADRDFPKLWLCGHVHHKHSYHIGNTLIACNPLGYPREGYNKPSLYKPMILEKDEANGKWSVKELQAGGHVVRPASYTADSAGV